MEPPVNLEQQAEQQDDLPGATGQSLSFAVPEITEVLEVKGIEDGVEDRAVTLERELSGMTLQHAIEHGELLTDDAA